MRMIIDVFSSCSGVGSANVLPSDSIEKMCLRKPIIHTDYFSWMSLQFMDPNDPPNLSLFSFSLLPLMSLSLLLCPTPHSACSPLKICAQDFFLLLLLFNSSCISRTSIVCPWFTCKSLLRSQSLSLCLWTSRSVMMIIIFMFILICYTD